MDIDVMPHNKYLNAEREARYMKRRSVAPDSLDVAYRAQRGIAVVERMHQIIRAGKTPAPTEESQP